MKMLHGFFRKGRKDWALFGALVIGFIFLIGILFARMNQVRKDAIQSAMDSRAPPVVTMVAKVTTAWKTISVLAQVDTGQTLDIYADVGGWVKERLVHLGQSVSKGEPLLVLYDERKQLALKEAESQLKASKAALKELERQLNQARKLYEEGILSRDTLDSILHQVEGQTASLDALQAAASRARWDVEHLIVRAPIGGRIVDIIPDTGQELLPGQRIMRIVSSNIHRVKAGVDAQWARALKEGMDVDLFTKNGGHLIKHRARLTGISPDIDPVSGTYSLEAEILDHDIPWLSGEVVFMLLPVEKLDKVIRVPRSCVLSDNEGSFIFVYKDGKALQVPVSVTWLNEQEGAISSEFLPQGASIIVEGHVGVANGQQVRVVKTLNPLENNTLK